ncbi:MAG TPA: hypothetical protein EYH31_00015 [Anaerolineae bacterium]|nr:hypothetical protein [Anaerolineae bacterium]
MRFEYHNFAFIGQESVWAAEAAYCANEQGMFWPYYYVLYANQSGENQGAFNPDKLRQFARDIGLDAKAFDKCFNSHRYVQQIQKDNAAARDRGIRSTPTFFVNGQELKGAHPFETFQQMIEAELAKVQ